MTTPSAFTDEQLRLVTLDPGHFHAALVQQQMLAGVAEEAAVYAPLGPDLLAHLGRIARFNARSLNPTRWRLRVYAGPDYLDRMLCEPKGSVAVLSGASRDKIRRAEQLVQRGMPALIDKPWILEQEDVAKLEAVLDDAERRRIVLFDGMTQRFEITCQIQRMLVNDERVFGTPLPGSPAQPSVVMESVHHLLKLVAGAPNLRPHWFFDIRQQGEGLTDVGTHLVDLVHWILFPEQALDHRTDIHILSANRWATVLSQPEFQRVTGEREFPPALQDAVRADGLHYFCNNELLYTVRGIHARLKTEWQYEAPGGTGEASTAIFRGSLSAIEVHQAAEHHQPEVYVVPNNALDKPEITQAVSSALQSASVQFPGLSIEDAGSRLRVFIPDSFRVGHEAHFSILLDTFLRYVRDPELQPEWEKSNLLAKYYVTTAGVALARKTASRTPNREEFQKG